MNCTTSKQLNILQQCFIVTQYSTLLHPSTLHLPNLLSTTSPAPPFHKENKTFVVSPLQLDTDRHSMQGAKTKHHDTGNNYFELHGFYTPRMYVYEGAFWIPDSYMHIMTDQAFVCQSYEHFPEKKH